MMTKRMYHPTPILTSNLLLLVLKCSTFELQAKEHIPWRKWSNYWHYQYFLHEQTPASKCWNQLVSLTLIALPTTFIMNLIELWQSLHTLRFLIIWSSIPGGVLISPNAITSFSLWWHNWNSHSSSSASCMTNFVSGTYLTSFICPNNLFSSAWISSICRWSWSLLQL